MRLSPSATKSVGEQANNTAKTMTIIALAFGGVGLITTVIGTVTGLFSTLAAI